MSLCDAKSPWCESLGFLGVIPRVISAIILFFQHFFLWCCITLIANEVIDLIMRRKERGFLCKLDIKKVYNWINQNFIVKVLEGIGWIKWCISAASFSILINDSPSGFFNSTGGLR